MVLAKEFNAIEKNTLNSRGRKIRNGFTILAVTSYLIQFLNKIIGSYIPYDLLVISAFLLLICSNSVIHIPKRCSYSMCWIPFLIVVFCHLIFSKFTIGFAVDWATYLVCISFVLLSGKNLFVFENVVKVAAVCALIYAASVWIQLLIPPVYTLYLRLLPGDAAANIQRYRSGAGSLTGFSSNPGFTAGHIVSGIIAFYATKPKNKKEKHIKVIAILFLFSALLLTGKRGHLLAVIFVCLFSYLIVSDSSKRILVINALLIAGAVGIPLLLVFSEVLSAIPALGRVSATIIGLINGEDITNGRSGLYAFAYSQFLAHPVFGIGWGQFRENVVGTVTLMTELDTHNIYLQLLCETGMIGFLSVIIPMILFLLNAVKNLKSTMANRLLTDMERQLAVFSLCYQLFFMLYGISGNPIYDYNYVLMYFISCAMTALITRKLRRST